MHWGLKGVAIPDAGLGYGARISDGETVVSVCKSGQLVGVAEYRHACSEAVYQSTRTEPLGRGFVRGHALPAHTADPNFRGFGKPSEQERGTAFKDVISPRGAELESEAAKELYRRTHCSYDPGEAATRRYEWPCAVAANPHFSFGAPNRADSNKQGLGVKNALSPAAAAQGRVIGPITVAHHRQVTGHQLGLSRSLLQAPPAFTEGHAFGLPSTLEPISAGELIRGSYSEEEQQPDPDLGRSIMVGRRNVLTECPFGMPSVRYDRPAPPREKRSVANTINFGDDAGTAGLLSPGRFAGSGVDESDFYARRSLEELRSIFKGAGLPDVPEEAMEAVAESTAEGEKTSTVADVVAALLQWPESAAQR